jgi:hypothetical protein
VAGRMNPEEAAAVSAPAGFDLARAVKNSSDPGSIARGVSAVAARMNPKEAAAVSAEAASALLQAIKDADALPVKDINAISSLADGLAGLARRMNTEDAASCATVLLQIMKANASNPNGSYALQRMAVSVSALAGRLEAGEAANARRQAAAILIHSMQGNRGTHDSLTLAEGLSALAAQMDPNEGLAICTQGAAAVVQAMRFLPDFNLRGRGQFPPDGRADLMQALWTLLSPKPPPTLNFRLANVASAVSNGQPLTAFAILQPMTEVPPCRLSTQQLVDLLKMPTCVGDARRLILDQLGNRYQQHFDDPWQFVRFAREQQLDLEFTRPPQRPESAR